MTVSLAVMKDDTPVLGAGLVRGARTAACGFSSIGVGGCVENAMLGAILSLDTSNAGTVGGNGKSESFRSR